MEKWAAEKNTGDDQREDDLKKDFHAPTDAGRFFLCYFQVVIGEPHSAEVNHAKKCQPNEAIIGTRPEQTGSEHGADNQNAAHCGRSLFAAVQFRKSMDFGSLSNRLAELEQGQFSNREVSEE